MIGKPITAADINAALKRAAKLAPVSVEPMPSPAEMAADPEAYARWRARQQGAHDAQTAAIRAEGRALFGDDAYDDEP